jgi:hypothetical protein
VKEKSLRLLAQAERCDERLVSGRILAVQVTEEPSALPYELHQPALRVVVLAVDSQVLGKLADALCEESNLNVGGADVCGVLSVSGRDISFSFFGEHALRFVALFLASRPVYQAGVRIGNSLGFG